MRNSDGKKRASEPLESVLTRTSDGNIPVFKKYLDIMMERVNSFEHIATAINTYIGLM